MTVTDAYFNKAVAFINSIGIITRFEAIETACFLPGLTIQQGEIIIDRNKLTFPGDIIHEAGHIAVVPATERKTLNAANIENRPDHAAEEMMAIAWSYAACIHLQIDPDFVFHEHGYHGGGKSIADNFNSGNYFGVPMLQYTGMAKRKPDDGGDDSDLYPVMKKWLRD